MRRALIGKDPDAGKDWGQEEKGMTEDEMVGWHEQLNGHAFGWTPGVGDGQGGLACCGPWGGKESDTTEQLNWTEHAPLSWLGSAVTRQVGWEDPVSMGVNRVKQRFNHQPHFEISCLISGFPIANALQIQVEKIHPCDWMADGVIVMDLKG